MSVKVGINGFGRIGRNILRSALAQSVNDIKFVAVNDLTSDDTLAHLFRYDSVHGRFPGRVTAGDGWLDIDGERIQVFSEPHPEKLPWAEVGVDIVLESTGRFRAHADASRHLSAGAQKVIVTAPSGDPDITIVMGVNTEQYDPAVHHIISNASCTTNCVAPLVKVLDEQFGFVNGLMTTVHSFTNDQRILDLPHSDLRRARAASMSIIPTTTGAAKATGIVLPSVAGKIDGMAMRVPTPDVSIVDLVANLGRDTTVEELNETFRSQAQGPLQGVLEYSDEPLVSIDYVGNPASSIVDGLATAVIGGSLVKVISWYDNEWGYSSRCVDLARFVAERLPAGASV
ncbi:MAG: type I glyceraldehyde-3-phosphate dehydrogenase [Gemmatimonadota bacterium]